MSDFDDIDAQALARVVSITRDAISRQPDEVPIEAVLDELDAGRVTFGATPEHLEVRIFDQPICEIDWNLIFPNGIPD